MNEFFLPNRPFYFPSREIKRGAYSEVASAMKRNTKYTIIIYIADIGCWYST